MSTNGATFLFTSESVNEGHPDKLCDQVSDSVLDACLAVDPRAKVACESATKTGMIMVFGEITVNGHIDYAKTVRDCVKFIGFDDNAKGFDYKTCSVFIALEEQSPDIAGGVHVGRDPLEVGAGDQGHMFGYATDETESRMPLTHEYATRLGERLTQVRKNGTCPWVRPDGKTQVSILYRNDNGAMIPQHVHTLVISTQHDDGVTNETIRAELRTHVIDHVIKAEHLHADTVYHLNPSGRFVIGGPQGDAGLTGRKIIVDTYGGWGAHGGGAFSGKDPTKVDRSAAYAARWVAKSIVDSKLARRCLFQVSYAIGVAQPLSVYIDTYGTGTKPDEEILAVIKRRFDLRPGAIIRDLDLLRPRYFKTACYGHFGRSDPDFTWETSVKDLA